MTMHHAPNSLETEIRSSPVEAKPVPASAAPRLWPAAALVAVYWAASLVVGWLEMPYFFRWLYSMAAALLLVLTYSIWWWTRRKVPLSRRAGGFLLVPAGLMVMVPLVHPSLGTFGLAFTGIPVVLTAATFWLLFAPATSCAWPRLGALLVVSLAWACFGLVRIDGVDTNLKPDVSWRWSPTPEELFLAERASDQQADPQPPAAEWKHTLTAGDWPAFRGPQRDGVLRGATIATDWNDAPPQQVWRRRVGPAWSSVIVVGDRLFTQEQRGDQEAVVCYDAHTGREIWAQADVSRFEEGVSGAGPRATPTFAEGRIYTLGARGMVNCLDAATGRRHWSRNTAEESSDPPPMWGYSGSPLVADGVVVVCAAGVGDANLRAFRADSGESLWTAPAGTMTYVSPQLATLAGRRQCLFVADKELISVDLATGNVLWKHEAAIATAPRCLQPHVIGDSQLLVGNLDRGVALIDVERSGDAWNVAQRWDSADLKPEFGDVVIHEGHAYGFDVSIFACIDLATGKRRWKGGRYGRGQVMLLPEQSLLLVLGESGEAVLLAANPERREEIGRFQALSGKTWNHPVVAHGRLYVRNAEEMACYEVGAR
jgi:outer membrane protein assembly factor BamB